MVVATRTSNPYSNLVRFDKRTVAELSAQSIEDMKPSELVRAAQAAVLPTGCRAGLENKDEATLRRIVFLARRSCRHEMSH